MKTPFLKPVLKFLGFFLLFYLLFMLVFPLMGLEKPYTNTFTNISEWLFEDFEGKGMIKFQEERKRDADGYDIFMQLVNKATYEKEYQRVQNQGSSGSVQMAVKSAIYNYSAWNRAYIPLVFLLALILSTPINIKRKALAAVLGLFLWTGFALWDFKMKLLYQFQSQDFLSYLDPDGLKAGFVNMLNKYFSPNLDILFLITVLIWILVSFRRKDWKEMLKWKDFQKKII